MESKAKQGKTVGEVVKDSLCTGCGTCVSICPHFAIELTKNDSKGIYLPHIDDKRCNRCGLCYDVCPGYAVDFKELNLAIFGKEPGDILLGNYLNCYIGYATDCEIRQNSASGGLTTTLLIYALEEGIIDGALVTKMKKGNPLEPEPFIARTKEDIISAAKSKYCPVPANVALREIMDSDGKYAIVGLPCHLHGIRKVEKVNKKLKEKISLHIGIFCAKTISFIGTEDLLQRRNIHKNDLSELNYRGGGYPGGMLIKLKNGRELFFPKSDYFDMRFGLFTPLRCNFCCDHSCELADISFGDAWLPEVLKYDKVGTSVVITRTGNAEDILQQMFQRGRIKLDTITPEALYETQGGFANKKKHLKVRIAISKLLGKKVPSFNNYLLQQLSFSDYLTSVIIYSGSYSGNIVASIVASKRSLWWLLDIYCVLLRFGNRLKSKIRL